MLSAYHEYSKNPMALSCRSSEKSDFLGQLTEKIRGCGVSLYIWTKKDTQDELDWSSLTGSDYEKQLERFLTMNGIFVIERFCV
jgi:hypothetical protein